MHLNVLIFPCYNCLPWLFALQIQLSFLYVGHTHEDIDQFFSTISQTLRHREAVTYEELLHVLPNSNKINHLFDIKSWIEPYVVDIKQHSKPLVFKFRKDLINPNKVNMFYKKGINKKWHYFQPGMFKTDMQGNILRPKGDPKLLSPNYIDLDLDAKQKKMKDVWKKYFDSQKEEALWDKFFNTITKKQSGPVEVWNLKKFKKYRPQDMGEQPETCLEEDKELDKLLQEEEDNPKVII